MSTKKAPPRQSFDRSQVAPHTETTIRPSVQFGTTTSRHPSIFSGVLFGHTHTHTRTHAPSMTPGSKLLCAGVTRDCDSPDWDWSADFVSVWCCCSSSVWDGHPNGHPNVQTAVATSQRLTTDQYSYSKYRGLHKWYFVPKQRNRLREAGAPPESGTCGIRHSAS